MSETRDGFVRWQCQLRRQAMRRDGGRPSPGMRPRVTVPNGLAIGGPITVLIVDDEAASTADVLRHMVTRTHDPRKRYEEGLRLLSSEYYQQPRRFSGLLTGLFSARSTSTQALLRGGGCVLHFEEDGVMFTVPCHVSALSPSDPAHQLTCWHGSVFNGALTAGAAIDVCVLAFEADWAQAVEGAAALR